MAKEIFFSRYRERTKRQGRGPNIELRQEISQIEVLDNLEGGKELVNSLKERILKNPNGFFVLWIFGETGSGKETIGGQILEEFKRDKRFETLDVKYISLATIVKEGSKKKRGIWTSPFGQVTPQELVKNADFMTHSVAWAQDNLPRPTLLFIEDAIGPVDLGFSAFVRFAKDSAGNRNVKNYVILNVTDPKVQDRAYRIRGPLWEEGEEENPEEIFRREKTVVNMKLKGKKEEIKTSMGNPVVRARMVPFMNQHLSALAGAGKLPGESPISPEEVAQSPLRRMRLLRTFYREIKKRIVNRLDIPADQILVSVNYFLDEPEIHFFRGTVKRHFLDLRKVEYPYENAPSPEEVKGYLTLEESPQG